jgi:hypothetical protein
MSSERTNECGICCSLLVSVALALAAVFFGPLEGGSTDVAEWQVFK